VPVLRKLARKYRHMTLSQASGLLSSRYHEERLLALLILVEIYKTADERSKKRIYHLYLDHTRWINNWDLVDTSAKDIVGAYLFPRTKKPLYLLAKSKNLWERRISIMSTFFFIKQNEFADTLSLAEFLLEDREDLIHKAVGWMLREIGNRDMETEERFLTKHYKKMPRTMLRYAIEKFPEDKRKKYLV
jgi:3-methyladenine DNA glycosylase AlkD